MQKTLKLPRYDATLRTDVCNLRTNAECYGVADADRNSVMGQGMQLRGVHADPWFQALRQFIAAEPPSRLYRPEDRFVKRISPESRQHFPRSVAEFEAGAHLHTLPAGR